MGENMKLAFEVVCFHHRYPCHQDSYGLGSIVTVDDHYDGSVEDG
jgi:hypothetical protein